tara:strand:- start:529 stop:1092 length:564 start_codon:yes stop_codon:yes gene_type:complete
MAELGKLEFELKGGDLEGTQVLTFVNNINVAESKAANYAKYDILARSSTIYAYLGAKSRTIKLSFDILLDHIRQFVGKDLAAFRGNMADSPSFTNDLKKGSPESELDHWVKVIQSCVANEGDKPEEGPPTVKFTYTKLYDKVLCIVKDYKIDIKAEDKAGFDGDPEGDASNLTPRLVSISLSLEEVK